MSKNGNYKNAIFKIFTKNKPKSTVFSSLKRSRFQRVVQRFRNLNGHNLLKKTTNHLLASTTTFCHLFAYHGLIFDQFGTSSHSVVQNARFFGSQTLFLALFCRYCAV
jgi:lauroyl/myristoyl acyltransferase